MPARRRLRAHAPCWCPMLAYFHRLDSRATEAKRRISHLRQPNAKLTTLLSLCPCFVLFRFVTPNRRQALRLDYLVQKVRPILTKLMSSGTGPQRGLFNVPVDPEKLGIPDYFKRVPEPMDLVSQAPRAVVVVCYCWRVCF